MTHPDSNGGVWSDQSAGSVTISRSVTFNSAAGSGSLAGSGVVNLFTLNGPTGKSINVRRVGAQILTDCVGASGTLALGVVGSTSIFIAATAVAQLVAATPVWTTTTTVAGAQAVPAAMKDTHVVANIIGTVATTAFSAGVIFFWVEYQAAMPGSYLTLT